MTVYVQRDGGGAITGVFANRQSGLAEEALADGDAGVAAFAARLTLPRPAALSTTALAAALIAKGVLAQGDISGAVTANAGGAVAAAIAALPPAQGTLS